MDTETVRRRNSKPSSRSCKAPSTPKLRASCDACSLSKVKCDREQPTCHRCTNSGITCNYSLSLRMGKASAASRTAGVKSKDGAQRSKPSTTGLSRVTSPDRETCNSSINPGTPQSDSPEQQISDIFGLRSPDFENELSKPWQDSTIIGDINSNYLTEWSSTSCDSYTENMLSTPIEFLSASSLGLPDSSISLDPQHDLLYNAPASTERLLACDDDMQRFFGVSTLEANNVNMNAVGGPLPSPPSSNADISNHDCTNLAKSTLNNLRLAPPEGTALQATSFLPTIDQALTSNRNAMKHMFTILSCLCAHDPHLPFLVAVVSSKMLAWYQAVARVSTSSFTTSDSTFAGTETVMHTPLTLGAYKLDGVYEERMKVQLVLSELRKMKELVEKFGERFCREEGGEKKRDGGVYSALEIFLQTRLRETVQALRV
ncbi:hypothetical protein MMC24_006355 [Lignoscripta atroalba]|nr:hypothetical protein [Lignoscripta atroalba]